MSKRAPSKSKARTTARVFPASSPPLGKSPESKMEVKCREMGKLYNPESRRCLKDTPANRKKLGLPSKSEEEVAKGVEPEKVEKVEKEKEDEGEEEKEKEKEGEEETENKNRETEEAPPISPRVSPRRRVRSRSPPRKVKPKPIGEVSLRAAAPTFRPTSRFPEEQQIILPTITAESVSVANEEEAEWANGLIKYLYNELLPYAEPNPIRRAYLVSEKAMTVWIPAFTHSSYNPNLGENYEVLEKLGDPKMKSCFNDFMIRKFPNINEAQMSRLTDYYLAKEFQGILSQRLGISPWVLTLIDKNLHTKEDVLESVFGALFLVADTRLPKIVINDPQSGILKFSPAYDTCYRFLESIYADVTGDQQILSELFVGPPENQIKEIFEKMRWTTLDPEHGKRRTLDEIAIYEQLDTGEYRTTLVFTDQFFEWLDKENESSIKQGKEPVVVTDRIFARAVGRTKTESKKEAFKRGVDSLAKLTFTWDWAEKEAKTEKTKDPRLVPYDSSVVKLIRDDGLADYKFSKQRRGAKVRFIQLIGIDKNKRQYILVTIDGTTKEGEKGVSNIELKVAAMKAYINRGIDPRPIKYSDV